MLFGQILADRDRLDHAALRRLDQRHLAERILRAVCGLLMIAAAVAQCDFFQRQPQFQRSPAYARGAIEPKALRLRRDGDKAVLQFSPEWADDHPRTLHLLREEAEAWAKQGPLRLVLPG